MKLKVLFALIIASLSLTACGEFKSMEKSSNEVFSSIEPYLTEEDKETMAEVSEDFEAPVTIRDNVLDSNAIEIEILGNIARLEIVNSGEVAFRLNGREVSFNDLKNKEVLEELILNSLMYANNSLSASVLRNTSTDAHAFLGGGVLSTVFRLVLTGIFNYATANLDPAVGDIVNTVGGAILGNQAPTTQNPTGNDNSGGGFLGSIFGSILGAITGNTNTPVLGGNTNTPNNPQQPSTQQPTQGGCNSLFCNLLGLFAGAILN